MPDDRLFHPKLLQSGKVDRLTDFERGVWFVSRLVCNDFGVLRFSANTLQEAVRFLERKPSKTVQRALMMVRNVGLLHTFTHETREFAFQWDWQDWQKITYPRGTLLPPPPADSLALCSTVTQELFQKHPGGWGRKKAEALSARLGNVSETVPEPFQERSENVFPKPLAVSRKPLAVSREPVTRLPVRADVTLHRSGHHRHAWCSERICVPDFTHDRLSRQLGRPDAGAWLTEWYQRVVDRIGSAPIGDKPEDFWPREFAAEFPPAASASKLTAALQKASDW